MISRRIVANLIVFFVVSFALVVYGVVNLLGNPLQSPTTLTTHFADASGLYPGFEVELNGVPVGTVTSTALTKTATTVTMRINPGTTVPNDVQSSVQIANDLGEQVVNLVPTRAGAAAALPSGAIVPAAANQVPANVGAVVASATRLLRAIPAGNLNKLIGELATSLSGQAGNLRTLISAGTTFSKEFVAYQQQFTELLANAPPTLDTLTSVAPQLRQDVANTAALVQVLAQQKTGLHTLLTSGSSAFNEVDNLLTSQSANLGCFLHDTANILSNIAEPTNLTNLSQGLTYNEYFFGAVDNIAVQGVAKPTTSNSPGSAQPDLPAHQAAPPADPRRASAVLRLGEHDPRHTAREPAASRRSAAAWDRPPNLASRRRPAARWWLPLRKMPTSRSRRSRRPARWPARRTASRPIASACCWCSAASSSRRCSWSGGPGPRDGGRGGGPDRCPRAPRWRTGKRDTRRENGET